MRTHLVIGAMLFCCLCEVQSRGTFTGLQDTQSQLRSSPDRRLSDEPSARETRKLFDLVKEGVQKGKVSLFASSLNSQVMVNLGGTESGYYSSSQAYYLLENHFRLHKVVSVEFETIHDADTTPYATGTMVYIRKGSRERAQLYVSLTKADGKWTITQVTIY
jgi:hypothetical protein